MKLRNYRILIVSLALLGAFLTWTLIHPLVTPFYAILVAWALAVMSLPSWVEDANKPKYRIEEIGSKLYVYRELPDGIFEIDNTCVGYCLKKSGNPIEDCKEIIEEDKKRLEMSFKIIHRCE